MTLRVLDLFSGIGGFSLGLERAGMQTVAFCEIDPFCRRVLAKHWPDIPCYDDVLTLDANRLQADGIAVDVICGGFPCQDISIAGRGAGINGKRSGLWSEYARIIGEVRPCYVIVENVAALLGRGISRILGNLATLGYDAEWHCIPACAIGAPHRRDRVWIVANAGCEQWLLADIARDGSKVMANSDCQGLSLSRSEPDGTQWREAGRLLASNSWWKAEPDVGRVAHGISSRMDRLRSLGNAVVPQITEIIGRAIIGSHERTKLGSHERTKHDCR